MPTFRQEPRRPNLRHLHACSIAVVWLAIAIGLPRDVKAQDALERLREDVRASHDPSDSPPTPSTPDRSPSNRSSLEYSDDDSDGWIPGELIGLAAYVGMATVTSPIWVPHAMLGDDFKVAGSFLHFPYEDGESYLVVGSSGGPCPPRSAGSEEGYFDLASTCTSRPWSGRVQCDWGGDLERLERIAGHLLVSTGSRLEWDSQFDYFREAQPGHRHDGLWLGDCNLAFRFAQSPNVLLRAGVGVNWLADAVDADFGVNFTYGFDIFPRRPWVLSSELDWGTLGSAELFRLRTTAGITLHGIEVYSGYEYLDIDRLHQNSLLGGVRLWF